MIKVFEMFSGYGGASFALKKARINFECIGHSEIDKYAVECFNNNFTNIKNYGDCKKINPNELPNFDLLTGGFPCQSFSVAGKGLGELDTRGTLFYEIIRILEVKKPKYVFLENVKGLTNKKHRETFSKILSELDRVGYNVDWNVLNTKNYGIPQNRERVFIVGFRKDLKFNFKIPDEEELKITIKNILEDEVDKKYYLSELMQKRFQKYLIEKETKIMAMRGRNPENPKSRKVGLPTIQMLEKRDDGCSNSLTTVQKDNLVFKKHRANEIREYDNFCPTLTESHQHNGGNNTPIIMQLCGDRDNPSLSLKKDVVNTIPHNPMSDRGQVVYDRKGFESRKEFFRESNISPTLLKMMGTGGNNVPMVSGTITQAFGRSGCSKEELRSAELNLNVTGNLRRLTPKECFRLMGFLNDEINLDGLSDTQKYKLAGNGWDINLVSKLFKEMLKNE